MRSLPEVRRGSARARRGTITSVTNFDLLLRGGVVIDGTGSPAVRADVGILGDRILAVGDLSHVDVTDVATVVDVDGHVVAPGFIDPHGHSDGSLFLDGALASHLHQGFTTQLSGNCGDSLAPITPAGRDVVDLSLRANGLVAHWASFEEYLDRVEEQPLGPNVAFLVGHGTIRAAVMGSDARQPTDLELASMTRELETALDAGAIGMSSGLIYAPGIHAQPTEVEALVAATARRGGLYATHMRNEADDLFGSLGEAVAAVRQAGPDARLQVSHLKAASTSVWGRAGEAVALLEAARAEGLDIGADQYPYTAAATTLATILPPALQALGVDECVAALADPHIRDVIRAEMERGISGWENVAADPGWDGIRIAYAPSQPEWSGRSLAALAEDLHADPADLAFDVLAADRLDVSVVIDCMAESDVETIMAVPWIAVCTDAEGRRPDHPILDAGLPHPRTYGSTARVLGRYVREHPILPLETAVAKLTAIPAARLRLHDRGVIREGALADVVVFDPVTVIDVATYEAPARYPTGIEHVIVNGRAAIIDGTETGARSGRLLRR
jgi:N-acyl-D-aspartate/D-glutamate deacylase